MAWDAHTEISDVTLSASFSCAAFSHDNVSCSTSKDAPECPSSTEWEDVRASDSSCNQDKEKEQHKLDENYERESNVEKQGEGALSCGPESEADDISPEELRKLIHAFNTMFEQNGGAACVCRVKEIGDSSLATMRNPVDLAEAVEKELNAAKRKLDETLQRLDSAVRTKVSAICSENADASAAADDVIEETKENNVCKDLRRRNTTLLRDCNRLLAVFATRICASVLETIERGKDVYTWSERVECVTSVSSRGIPQMRIISKRFADAIGRGQKHTNGSDCPKDLVGLTTKLADAAVEHVVQCVALAVAVLKVEVAEKAYQCCA